MLHVIKETRGYWRNWDSVLAELERYMPEVPDKVAIAKVRRLTKKGLVHACVHKSATQCRGDIHLPEECRGC